MTQVPTHLQQNVIIIIIQSKEVYFLVIMYQLGGDPEICTVACNYENGTLLRKYLEGYGYLLQDIKS